MDDATSSLAAAPVTQAPNGQAPGAQYLVIARRYRPQTFDELIGQEHVRTAMAGAIESERVGHAYLFTGARGVGKTSSARILAKSLNCIHGPTTTPCNECEICRDISSGVDVDVLEIDGASNRGVDEIRQLRQNVAVRPSRARFKIYIIDEVHMLTREAFNALLKTLEEPPEHVKFIFCTTEPEKVPITIHSRCQRFDFAGISAAAIVERLVDICQHENVNAERAALEIIARRANGSMRDSQSLLEQVLSCCGGQLTAEGLHKLLGTASGNRFTQLVAALVERDTATALTELDAAIAEGVDVGQLLEQMLGYFRDVMAAGVGCGAASFLHATSSDEPRVRAAVEKLGLENILAILQIIDQTLARLRLSTHARTLAEIAVVRICKLEDLDDLATLVAAVRGGATSGPAGGAGEQKKNLADAATTLRGPHNPSGYQAASAPRDSVSQAKSGAVAVGPSTAANVEVDQPVRRVDVASTSPETTYGATDTVSRVDSTHAANSPTLDSTEPASPSDSPSVALTPENATLIWQQALAGMTDMVADQAAMCDGVTLAGANRLVVRFPRKYNAVKVSCERPEQTAKLERRLAEVAGGVVRLEFVVDESAAPEKPVAPLAATSRQRTAERTQHPLVKRAMELFGATNVRVEEPRPQS